MTRPRKAWSHRRMSGKLLKICPACDGRGQVCCETWAMVRVNADDDLEFNDLGMPLWPLASGLEMAYCPFCGKRFEPRARST